MKLESLCACLCICPIIVVPNLTSLQQTTITNVVRRIIKSSELPFERQAPKHTVGIVRPTLRVFYASSCSYVAIAVHHTTHMPVLHVPQRGCTIWQPEGHRWLCGVGSTKPKHCRGWEPASK